MTTDSTRTPALGGLVAAAALLGLLPALFHLTTLATSSVALTTQRWTEAALIVLRDGLRYSVALLVYSALSRRPSNRPRGHLGGLVAGTLVSGALLMAAANLFPATLAAYASPTRLFFEVAEAAVIGWCLLAAQTIWLRHWFTPLVGALMGSVVSSVSLAWTPLEGGAGMAVFWGLRNLVTFAPPALLFHLAYLRRTPSPGDAGPAEDDGQPPGLD